MQITKNKVATMAIIILLTLSLAAAMTSGQVFFPPGTEIPTYAYINVAPNPIGVGQTVNVNFFLATVIESSEPPTNMTVKITDPDGNTETRGPFTGDTTGGTFFNFVPDQAGEWKFQFFYGGQITGAGGGFGPPMYVGLVQLPSESKVFTLTVQEEPIYRTTYPTTPLPTRWWQTPVSAQNVDNWYKIMGPWLGLGGNVFANTGSYGPGEYCNPYTDPVLSGHLLWTKVWCPGGVVGGIVGGNQESGHYWSTRQYWPQYAPVIMNGIMYSTWYPETTGYSAGILATDLFTGETLFRINTTSVLRCGMTTEWKTANMYGVIGPYIWTTGALPSSETGGVFIGSTGFEMGPFGPSPRPQYNLYSALTGQYVLSVVNGSSMTIKEDEHGHLIGYYINSTVGTMYIYGNAPPFGGQPFKEAVEITAGHPVLCRFNMSQALGNSWGWAPSLNTAIDFGRGVMWAKPVPTEINGVPISPALSINGLTGDAVVLSAGYVHMQGGGDEQPGWLINCGMDQETGAVLMCKNYTYPTYESLLPFTRTARSNINGLTIITNLVNFKVEAFDLHTGNKAWESTLKTPYGDGTPNIYETFGIYGRNAEDLLLLFGLGGDMWAYDTNNGEELWYTNTTTLIGDPGIETPYDIWPLWVFTCQAFTPEVAYVAIGHEYNPPLFHGAQLLAVNLTDGTLIWSELGTYIRAVSIAYNILLSLNAYDNQIYAFGKGPTATTVTAPQTVGITTETPVTITGTVMDVSPGTEQSLVALNFPNGLPCVSDESQSKWMEYVYQQQPMPTDATGVPVTLSVEDANGNVYEIGTATTDTSGTFGFTWTPIIPGDYKVIATYAGSNSYYGSCAVTYFYANEAPQPTPEPTPVPQAPVETYFTVSTIAIIAAIAIIGFLILRKR